MLERNCNYLAWLAVRTRDHAICISYIQKLKMKDWPLDTIVVLEIKPAELNLLWLLNDSAHQFEYIMKFLLEDGTIIIDGIMKVPEMEWKCSSLNPLFQNTSLKWTFWTAHVILFWALEKYSVFFRILEGDQSCNNFSLSTRYSELYSVFCGWSGFAL